MNIKGVAKWGSVFEAKSVQTACYFQSFPDFQKLAVKTLPLSNLFQAIPLSLSLYHPWLLAAILKLPYLCCYGVLNTKQFKRPLVIFSHSQICKNSQSKHCHFQTFSNKLNSTFTFAFITVVVFLSTRLVVILQFP